MREAGREGDREGRGGKKEGGREGGRGRKGESRRLREQWKFLIEFRA